MILSYSRHCYHYPRGITIRRADYWPWTAVGVEFYKKSHLRNFTALFKHGIPVLTYNWLPCHNTNILLDTDPQTLILNTIEMISPNDGEWFNPEAVRNCYENHPINDIRLMNRMFVLYSLNRPIQPVTPEQSLSDIDIITHS